MKSIREMINLIESVDEGWFDKDYQKFDQEKNKAKIFSPEFVKDVKQFLQGHNSGDIARHYLMYKNGKPINPKDMKPEFTWTDHTILWDWMNEALDRVEQKNPGVTASTGDPNFWKQVYDIVGLKLEMAITNQANEGQIEEASPDALATIDKLYKK